MSENFEEFWNSSFAIPVEDILADELAEISDDDVAQRSRELHAYAANTENFEPEVREAIEQTSQYFPYLLDAMLWEDATFISDSPGKNAGLEGLGGGGESTRHLVNAVQNAEHSILIQSPYLVLAVPRMGVASNASISRR